MSSPVLLRGRGQDCHCQPSCSAAVPDSTQIHPRQQQKKGKHKRLMFKSFLEATDPSQCSLSILSPSMDFSLMPVFLSPPRPDLKSAETTADPPPPRNSNQRLLCWKSREAVAAAHISIMEADIHLCLSLCCRWEQLWSKLNSTGMALHPLSHNPSHHRKKKTNPCSLLPCVQISCYISPGEKTFSH